MERSEADAVVLERSQVVGPARKRSLEHVPDPGEHGLLHVLLDGGEDQRADLGYRATAVRIHPDDGAATTRFLNRGRGPQADVARHREDDVSALRNEILTY